MTEASHPPPGVPPPADRASYPSLPNNPLASVTEVDFPVALRGYDRVAVDAYVRRVSQLVAELQAARSPEAAVRRALDRVGEEVTGILERAHKSAEQITASSRQEADEHVSAARAEAAELVAAAQRRLKELDAETDRIWAERHQIVQDTRVLAERLLALVQDATARLPPDADEAIEEEFERPGQEEPHAAAPSAPDTGAQIDPASEATVVMPPVEDELP